MKTAYKKSHQKIIYSELEMKRIKRAIKKQKHPENTTPVTISKTEIPFDELLKKVKNNS